MTPLYLRATPPVAYRHFPAPASHKINPREYLHSNNYLISPSAIPDTIHYLGTHLLPKSSSIVLSNSSLRSKVLSTTHSIWLFPHPPSTRLTGVILDSKFERVSQVLGSELEMSSLRFPTSIESQIYYSADSFEITGRMCFCSLWFLFTSKPVLQGFFFQLRRSISSCGPRIYLPLPFQIATADCNSS